MTDKKHELKAWPVYFEPIMEGCKCCDLRFDDRGYQVGDVLLLREWDPLAQEYTGRSIIAEVLHVMKDTRFGLKPGWVCLSIEVDSILI